MSNVQVLHIRVPRLKYLKLQGYIKNGQITSLINKLLDSHLASLNEHEANELLVKTELAKLESRKQVLEDEILSKRVILESIKERAESERVERLKDSAKFVRAVKDSGLLRSL